MKRLFLSACAVALGLSGLTIAPADANSLRYAPPPPVMLSPDQIDPWVMQVRPGSFRIEPRDARPRVTSRRVAPAPQRTRQASIAKTKQRVRSIDPRFLPTVVDYDGPHKPGTIIVNTNERYLYLINNDGTARRYGVGVGRPGFEWAGRHKVTRKAEWPSWRPPAEMRQRQPGLPAFMEGGPRNPLGARALYLGSTLYRIHGSNEPWSIGQAVSSGCIRMRNQDVQDLYTRVRVGTNVVVI
ncbi:L,D-transpeptidase [Cohaesibacter celericrescens]|uniref:L,D-transpeptidase n=1 Tax=Cohaesibacter celericrescens TaxID=2067669 RepID=A0A2N5XKK5_9HYPH|nr:L,D-transpeptidase [Cohaesibacter celericrescens]PLW75005.1 L,D-transpeptidase [Cohaesibacter celericrescens]